MAQHTQAPSEIRGVQMEHQPPRELGLPYSVHILRPYAVSGFKGRSHLPAVSVRMRWFIFAHKADGRNVLVGHFEDDGLWSLSRQIFTDILLPA